MVEKFPKIENASSIEMQFESLIEGGGSIKSEDPMLQRLKGIKKIKAEDAKKLNPYFSHVKLTDKLAGFGYMSSSNKHNEGSQDICTAYLMDTYKKKGVKPLAISIDRIFRFLPEDTKIVKKIQEFDLTAKKKASDKKYAIILSGVCDSKIFTEKVLEEIPFQNNAGMELGKETELGKKLYDFSENIIGQILKSNNGDLEKVLEEFSKFGNEEDARLLLATSLMQQGQYWQNLYDKSDNHTPLFVVAPKSFHDAMNRLNNMWGHGPNDYTYRANLGNNDDPPFEEPEDIMPYHKQGLSEEEFSQRIKPILTKIMQEK